MSSSALYKHLKALNRIEPYTRRSAPWVVPTVNASHVKAISRRGLRAQDIPLAAVRKPALPVDPGSPNTTSRVTQDFFETLGAARSFSRVRRPTDNAIIDGGAFHILRPDEAGSIQ